MLEPLKQWICDTCDEVIETPDDGWVEWQRDESGHVFGFRICHRGERFRDRGCKEYRGGPDMGLEDFCGEVGMARMLSFLHAGPLLDAESEQTHRVRDFANWTDTFRRLFVAHYDEARASFEKAQSDGFFDGANEVFPYKPKVLKEIIERYGDEE